ncbi:uncharacterized protein LOC121870823 [Homarus americanus]|uniref:uncharacterized protein LOC121870823 n=1 Tax=Homarus americanus TaxID=6706 RepID=UPI001C45814C|nr:uncharacterized protein LOC121870823 [Homarus americanus]
MEKYLRPEPDCVSYDATIQVLQDLYVKPKNEVFARHLLAIRRQHSGESLDEYLLKLHQLSKDCNFKAVTTEANRDDYIRDVFINGLLSPMIRQNLLENKTLDLATAFDQARALDLAQRNSVSYLRSQAPMNTAAVTSPEKIDSDDSPLLAATQQPKCFFCGGARHNRPQCPACDLTCHKCNKKGHFAKEHDENLSRFLDRAKKSIFTFNEDKSVFSETSIDLLGYTISHGTLKPDADRFRPLKELPLPKDLPALRRVIGLFSYYSQRISHFSDKVRPFVKAQTFPLRLRKS